MGKQDIIRSRKTNTDAKWETAVQVVVQSWAIKGFLLYSRQQQQQQRIYKLTYFRYQIQISQLSVKCRNTLPDYLIIQLGKYVNNRSHSIRT